MIPKGILFFILILVCASCKQFSNNKNTELISIDSLDLSVVDESPAFKECEQLLDAARTACFRANMRQKITKYLRKQLVSSRKKIEETIVVILTINKEGKIQIKNIESSKAIEDALPSVDSILQTVVSNLPELRPATKRGIKVTTQYRLPIKIRTREVK